MMPMALASLVCPGVARVLAHRIGYRTVLTVGSVTVASSFGCFALLHSNVAQILVMMLLLGIGIGLAYSVMPALIVARTPEDRVGSATGVNQVLRLLGGAFGAALIAMVLAAYTPAGENGPREAGLVVATLVSCAGALVAAVVAVAVPASTGRPARGCRQPHDRRIDQQGREHEGSEAGQEPRPERRGA